MMYYKTPLLRFLRMYLNPGEIAIYTPGCTESPPTNHRISWGKSRDSWAYQMRNGSKKKVRQSQK